MVWDVADSSAGFTIREESEMEKPPKVALLEHFATLPDPRIERHRWHKLSDILVIAVCCGPVRGRELSGH